MQVLQPFRIVPVPIPATTLLPPFRLLLADEPQDVFQGVTLSRVLSVCLCERDWDWWGGVAASSFNFYFWIFPHYCSGSWLLARVLKSLFKNLRKERSEEYLSYEKWASKTKNPLFCFSLSCHIIAVHFRRPCILCMLRQQQVMQYWWQFSFS